MLAAEPIAKAPPRTPAKLASQVTNTCLQMWWLSGVTLHRQHRCCATPRQRGPPNMMRLQPTYRQSKVKPSKQVTLASDAITLFGCETSATLLFLLYLDTAALSLSDEEYTKGMAWYELQRRCSL